MNILRNTILLAVFCLFSSAVIGADKVAEQIMKTYQDQSDKLKKTTVDKLKARQAALQKSGDENAAGEIQTMIDNMEVQGNIKEQMITVPAKAADRGVKIGDFKKGDKITLQYVKGTWTHNKDRAKLLSPDEAGGVVPVEIFAQAKKPVDTKSFGDIPKGTSSVPFEYTFEEDVKDVVLRIRIYSGGGYDQRLCEGEVTYKVTVEKFK